MNQNNSIDFASVDNILANLDVDYKDLSVLTTDSKELQLVDYFFKSITCNDEGIENLLYEVIGYSLCKTSSLCKGFIFKGEGRNGKSKVFRIIESLVGDKQCSHEHLENLSGSRLGSKSTVKNLKGCTANISEDQTQPRFVNTSLITRIISGEPIAIEERGKHIEDLVPYATMLFSVNEVIDFKGAGLHITDRFWIIPFNAVFTEKNGNRNINIEAELCQPKALQIIATRAIQAFIKVLNNGKFTIPPIVESETKKYFLECNNIDEFCELYPINTIIIKSKYYTEYRKWCDYNNKQAVSNEIFGKRIIALGHRAERYSFGKARHTYYTAPKFNNIESRDFYNKYLAYCGLCEETERVKSDKALEEDYTTFDNYLWNFECKRNIDIDNK